MIISLHATAHQKKKYFGQKKLLVNKINKNDVIKILGAPSTKSILEDDLWIYIENRKSRSSLFKLGKEVVLTSNVLVLEIDDYGLLKKKDFYNQNDMNNIIVAKDITGKKFKKNSFLYNFFSSLRQKINDPLNKRVEKQKEISQR